MGIEERTAFLYAQISLMNAEIAGMTAENQIALATGEVPRYNHGHFRQVMASYEGTLGHNGAITFLQGG